jgi:hypothetical protein
MAISLNWFAVFSSHVISSCIIVFSVFSTNMEIVVLWWPLQCIFCSLPLSILPVYYIAQFYRFRLVSSRIISLLILFLVIRRHLKCTSKSVARILLLRYSVNGHISLPCNGTCNYSCVVKYVFRNCSTLIGLLPCIRNSCPFVSSAIITRV